MNKVKDILFAACVLLALASILSCSSGGGGNEVDYSYCILANNICLDGPFTASTCKGQLSNNCPFKSSSSSAGSEVSSSAGGEVSSSAGSEVSSSSYGSSSSVAINNDACHDAATEKNSVTYDGQIYETIQIGTQVWMKKNLNYAASGSKCGNGSALSDDNTPTCDNYGRLYDWATAMALPFSCNSSTCSSQVQAKHQGICPEGWHIPSNEEWVQLYRFADSTTGNSNPYESPSAGKLLKAQTGWDSNGNGLDTHCFSALPGGYGSGTSFNDSGLYGNWWSSSEGNGDKAYLWYMFYHNDYAYWDNNFNKSYLFSVRCIQD